MAKRTATNGLAVGDEVVSFRGVLGTVTAIEVDRGAGRSDMVTVVDEDGNNWWNYETVWGHR
jgi:preprotein translocase subunit YajC